MKDIIKPEVEIIFIDPGTEMDNTTVIEYSIRAFSGEFTGYLELETDLIAKYVNRIEDLVVEELIKDLNGVEI